MPRAAPTAWLRLSRGSPTCQSPVPALEIATRADRPASFTTWRMTASAVGDRQMLPRHTKQTRTTTLLVGVPGGAVRLRRLGGRGIGHGLGVDDARRLFLGEHRLELGGRADALLASAPLGLAILLVARADRDVGLLD